MPEVPDFIRKAIEAQGQVDPETLVVEDNVIPSDEAELAFQQGAWRHELGDLEPPVDDLPPPPEQFELDVGAGLDVDGEAVAADELSRYRGWRAKAWQVILGLVKLGDEFTSDEFWMLMTDVPAEPRWLGPLLSEASKQGLIVNTGRHRPSALAGRHSRPVAIWKPL